MVDDAEHHIDLLLGEKGPRAWDEWRRENPNIRPNLRGAYLEGKDLTYMDLRDANFRSANLRGAKLWNANLNRADLSEAQLMDADLGHVTLREANLKNARLNGATLRKTDFYKADLSGADLSGSNLEMAILMRANLRFANLCSAILVETDLRGADLTGCHVHGVSAWGVDLKGAKQQDLVITHALEPQITIDNIEVAQFVYLLLHNEKIRDVIDTIGRKGVLLLGRFTEGRIEILEQLRKKLRRLGYVPMVFNFDKPETKDFTETVRLLANLSRFVIVDITKPRSTPLELQAIAPDYMIPFVPILEEGQPSFSMFVDLQNKYDWVLKPVIIYPSVSRLIDVFEDRIVRPAETKFNELLTRRTEQLRVEKV